jgi:RNA ligase (TIGR02306 family)
MSETIIEVVPVHYIKPHPDADRLEIAIIKGTTVCVQKGTFSVGQLVFFFPPDILIPETWADHFQVKNYLKHAMLDGKKQQCRVAATRLRGQPSYGFVAPIESVVSEQPFQAGDNATVFFDAEKYVPPQRPGSGEAEKEHPAFHKYTSIENFYRYPDAIADGTPVRITEKIHGTNSRVGLVAVLDEWTFAAGSHHVRKKAPPEGCNSTPLYWRPLDDQAMLDLLTDLNDGQNNVMVFGEIYGVGIQDMDYGTEGGYRVFDISVNGRYLDYEALAAACTKHGVEMVPVLYVGPFSKDVLEQFTHGPTTLADAGNIKSPYKGREGVVVTPLVEQFYAPTGGRLILKSVSADYLGRKGGTDVE